MTREEAIERLEGGAPFSELYDSHWEDALALAIKALKEEPVKHGEWLPEITDLGTMIFYCSACKRVSDVHWAYCPRCGAKMDGKTDGQID